MRVGYPWLTLFIFLFLYTQKVNGQQFFSMKGSIVEEVSNQPIPSAIIQLLNLTDSSLAAFAIATADGTFLIETKVSNIYLLKISSLGYATRFLTVQLDRNVEDFKVYLEKEDFQLKEIIIQESSPAVIRNDTTTYSVDKYKQEGENTLGDLLNNMPNFRVEESGEVFFKNRRIDKVMLDGDDLIGENYKAVIKSLDPSVLNQVQVVENFQDNRFLSGVEAGTKTVLNLGVKEDRKQLLFGSLGMGLGPVAYNGLANVFSYIGKFKAYVLGSTNNIGIRREDQSSGRELNTLSNFSKTWNWSPLQNIDQYIPFFLKTSYENPNKERFGNVNLSYRPKEDVSFVSSFNLYSDRNEFFREDLSEFLVDPPFAISQKDTLFRKPRMIEHRLNAEMALSSRTGLRFDHLLQSNENFLGQRLLFDDGISEEFRLQEMSSQRKTWNALLELTTKLNEGNAIVFGSFIRRESLNESLLSNLLQSRNDEDSLNISQDLQHRMYQSGVQLRWFWSGEVLRLENQLSYQHQRFNLDAQRKQIKEEELVRMEVKTPSVFQKISWEKGRFNFNYSHRVEYQLLQTAPDMNTRRWNWQRDATAIYKVNQDNIFNAGFGVEIQPLHGSLLAESPLFLDFRTARQGSKLTVWNRQLNYFIGHHYNDIFKRKLSVSTNLFWVRNPTLWTLNTMELRPELVFMKLGTTTLNESKGLMVKIDKLIFPVRGNVRLDINVWQAGFEEMVNGAQRFSTSLAPSLGFRYSSAFKGAFNMEVKGYFQQNRMNIQQGAEVSKNNFMNSNQTMTLRLKLGKINTKVIAENFTFDGQSFQFVNYRVVYNFKDRLNFYSEGRNLLNTKTFSMGRFTPNQFIQKSYSLLGRIVTVGVNWYF